MASPKSQVLHNTTVINSKVLAGGKASAKMDPVSHLQVLLSEASDIFSVSPTS